jgi:hypothetical protein
MKNLFAGGAVLALAACAVQPAPLGPPIVMSAAPGLTSAAIRDAIVGQTGVGTMSGSNIVYSMYVAPDGTALAKLPTGVDPGNWRLTEDGQWCVAWKLFRGGEEYCQRVYHEGAGYKFVNSNSQELLTFAPGKGV